jgi:hypothetical protein
MQRSIATAVGCCQRTCLLQLQVARCQSLVQQMIHDTCLALHPTECPPGPAWTAVCCPCPQPQGYMPTQDAKNAVADLRRRANEELQVNLDLLYAQRTPAPVLAVLITPTARGLPPHVSMESAARCPAAMHAVLHTSRML